MRFVPFMASLMWAVRVQSRSDVLRAGCAVGPFAHHLNIEVQAKPVGTPWPEWNESIGDPSSEAAC